MRIHQDLTKTQGQEIVLYPGALLRTRAKELSGAKVTSFLRAYLLSLAPCSLLLLLPFTVLFPQSFLPHNFNLDLAS